MAYETYRGLADRIVGNLNPTLAYGIDIANDYTTSSQFIDIAREMRPWVSVTTDGKLSFDDMTAQGLVDDNGYVTRLPDGAEWVETIWAWSADPAFAEPRKGLYVLTYEGEGEIKVDGRAHIVSQEAGRIVLENKTGGFFRLYVDPDPEGTGDYVRDISIVHESNLALHEAGAIFNPEWLSVISDARQIRFMDFMQTNNSEQGDWAARPTMDDVTWSVSGAPVELMVALANEAGADPWFCMPYGASEEYVREFATYVRDHLDPRLTASVELSNEMWNGAFHQADQIKEGFLADWPGEDTTGGSVVHYVAKKATEVALIWDDVFGDEADARVQNVLSTHSRLPWRTEQLLDPVTWFEREPDAAVAPASVFDAIGITTYFGGAEMALVEDAAALIAAIEDPEIDAFEWLHEKLLDPDHVGSVPDSFVNRLLQKEIADRYGLDLVSYEGGQHAHHTFAVRADMKAYVKVLDSFMRDFVKSPQMADLYEELWRGWAEIGDGPFMQYGAVEAASKSGSWGLREWVGDENPRAVALDALNASETPWWDADASEAYGQGVTERGTDGDDVLAGTRAEDILSGGLGDDILIGGLGDDRIHGGEGQDVLVLNGQAAEYSFALDGDALIMTGVDGVDRVVDVELFAFENVTVSLEELRAQADGDMQAWATAPALAILIAAPEEAPQENLAELALQTGGDDADRIEGGAEGDWLRGGAGDDRLRGFRGDDVLDGGEGGDTLFGGEGADVFVFGHDSGKRDWIADYAAEDAIDLRELGLSDDTTATDLAVELGNGRLMLDWGDGEVVLLNCTMADLDHVTLLI